MTPQPITIIMIGLNTDKKGRKPEKTINIQLLGIYDIQIEAVEFLKGRIEDGKKLGLR